MDFIVLMGVNAALFSDEMISEMYKTQQIDYETISMNVFYSCMICFGLSVMIRQLIAIEHKLSIIKRQGAFCGPC